MFDGESPVTEPGRWYHVIATEGYLGWLLTYQQHGDTSTSRYNTNKSTAYIRMKYYIMGRMGEMQENDIRWGKNIDWPVGTAPSNSPSNSWFSSLPRQDRNWRQNHWPWQTTTTCQICHYRWKTGSCIITTQYTPAKKNPTQCAGTSCVTSWFEP